MKSRDLHLVSPIERGADVQAVQQKLHDLGYSPGVIDGKYGATTAAAVRLFQKAHKLRQDGVVGANTRAALKAAKKPLGGVKRPSKPSHVGLAMLAEARKHVGVKENPKGSNSTKFGKWFGVDRVAWCAIFMSYCAVTGAKVVLGKGAKAGSYPKGMAYVPYLEAWLKTTGRWVGRTTPRPGDIAIFNWDGGVADHVGIVEEDLGGGKFSTIEGNTAIGNDSNGGEVMRRTRYISQVNGFGRFA